MTHEELRKKFLDYFDNRSHRIIPSSSLIPDNDPTVLLTTAGMQQFKPYFNGEKDPMALFGNKNLVSIQKCFRTSDIEAVGDSSHDTFFEMLGNFSLGGYGKKEAIRYTWELMTADEYFGLPKDKFFVTVFSGDEGIPPDEEAERFWQEVTGGIEVRKFGKSDNFWPKPVWVGTCGPSSELHYILGKESIEVWNLVFTEYFHTEEDEYKNLGEVKIDTGMGLERLAMVTQKKASIFETDLFWSIIEGIQRSFFDKTYGQDQKIDRAYRIMADHLRGIDFLIADGVEPSNKERGYVLRRLIRRAVTQKYLYGNKDRSISELVDNVVGIYGQTYPNLKDTKAKVKRVIQQEEERFNKALDAGVREFNKNKTLSAEVAFRLYESYGLPLDIMEELSAGEVDKKGFNELFKKHQVISRQA